jgi:predicted MFS family arabinose efflux permease
MALMGLALFVAGFAIAPSLIAVMSTIEQTVPPARLTEGIAISHTGLAAGLAPGSAFAGLLIDAHGASSGYLVALCGGVVAALTSLALPLSFRMGADPAAGDDDGAGRLSVL